MKWLVLTLVVGSIAVSCARSTRHPEDDVCPSRPARKRLNRRTTCQRSMYRRLTSGSDPHLWSAPAITAHRTPTAASCVEEVPDDPYGDGYEVT